MPYTIQQKINIARVSQYLCGNDVEKRGLFGGGQDLNLERKIYCVRKSIEFMYNLYLESLGTSDNAILINSADILLINSTDQLLLQ